MRHRILVLSANLPYPPHSGPTNRTLHIIRELRRSFDVYLVAFARRGHHAGPEERRFAFEALASELDGIEPPAPIQSEWSRISKLMTHAFSVTSRRPYTYYEYKSDVFATSLQHALRVAQPALVHIDSLDLYRWAAKLPAVPVTCTHHSVESELLRRRAELLRVPARQYVRCQASLIERVERTLTPLFSLNLMVSSRDAEYLQRLAPQAKTLVVPNGVDVERLQPRQDVKPISARIVFLGPLYVFANREAVDHFLANAWPAIRARVPDASFRVIGECPSDIRDRLGSVPGVQCAGYVEDLAPELAAAQCAVVPLRLGGGTRLKIVDAWAAGLPVVSTTIGAEGLEAINGRNILIADDTEGFVAAVVSVLQRGELRQNLSGEGRRTAARYDWAVIGRTLRDVYADLISG